jgi:hypothetical protein
MTRGVLWRVSGATGNEADFRKAPSSLHACKKVGRQKLRLGSGSLPSSPWRLFDPAFLYNISSWVEINEDNVNGF